MCLKCIFALINGYGGSGIVALCYNSVVSDLPLVVGFFSVIPDCLISRFVNEKLGLVESSCFGFFGYKLGGKLTINRRYPHLGHSSEAGDKPYGDLFCAVCSTLIKIIGNIDEYVAFYKRRFANKVRFGKGGQRSVGNGFGVPICRFLIRVDIYFRLGKCGMYGRY